MPPRHPLGVPPCPPQPCVNSTPNSPVRVVQHDRIVADRLPPRAAWVGWCGPPAQGEGGPGAVKSQHTHSAALARPVEPHRVQVRTRRPERQVPALPLGPSPALPCHALPCPQLQAPPPGRGVPHEEVRPQVAHPRGVHPHRRFAVGVQREEGWAGRRGGRSRLERHAGSAVSGQSASSPAAPRLPSPWLRLDDIQHGAKLCFTPTCRVAQLVLLPPVVGLGRDEVLVHPEQRDLQAERRTPLLQGCSLKRGAWQTITIK